MTHGTANPPGREYVQLRGILQAAGIEYTYSSVAGSDVWVPMDGTSLADMVTEMRRIARAGRFMVGGRSKQRAQGS